MTIEANNNPEEKVRAIYRRLAGSWGAQHWWPAETPFEVIVGAILTQNTSWKNVERALASLRAANALSIAGIRGLELPELEQLIRSSGYYRQKADRLKRFVSFLDERYGGSLKKMFAVPTEPLRGELLSLKGIGQETADAILLYAGNHEIFVVDAYARRILARHAIVSEDAKYETIRTLVERALHDEAVHAVAAPERPSKMQVHQPSPMSASQRTPRTQTYNEMHGLFVQVGKHFCDKAQPRCEQCPLCPLLPPK